MKKLNSEDLERLFLNSRTVNRFENKEVTDDLIKELYNLTKMGPTAFNAQPARYIFIKSTEGKERLRPYLMEGNIEKTMNAPLTVIIASDYKFYELLNKTFPVAEIKGYFVGNEEMINTTAFRNSSLSAGYFTIAARSLGLDVGPMSGFDNKGLDKEFFSGTDIKSNLLINIGYGISDNKYKRLPRLDFNETSQII